MREILNETERCVFLFCLKNKDVLLVFLFLKWPFSALPTFPSPPTPNQQKIFLIKKHTSKTRTPPVFVLGVDLGMYPCWGLSQCAALRARGKNRTSGKWFLFGLSLNIFPSATHMLWEFWSWNLRLCAMYLLLLFWLAILFKFSGVSLMIANSLWLAIGF